MPPPPPPPLPPPAVASSSIAAAEKAPHRDGRKVGAPALGQSEVAAQKQGLRATGKLAVCVFHSRRTTDPADFNGRYTSSGRAWWCRRERFH